MEATTSGGRYLELWVAAVLIGVDQLTKAAIRAWLPLHESITIVPGFLDLTRVHNSGAAFGMLNAMQFPGKTALLVTVALAALVAVAWYSASLPSEQRLARIGLACILGGAAGNLIDRITTGYVIDFVDAHYAGWHFWAFNVADSAITVGVAIMILDLLGVGHRRVSETL